MRTKTIVYGFKNSQKFRYIVRQVDTNSNAVEFVMTQTIADFFDSVGSTIVRYAVHNVLLNLANDRFIALGLNRDVPISLATRVTTYDHNARSVQLDVQIDLA